MARQISVRYVLKCTAEMVRKAKRAEVHTTPWPRLKRDCPNHQRLEQPLFTVSHTEVTCSIQVETPSSMALTVMQMIVFR